MKNSLNATEMREFVEALEERGLTVELAQKVISSDILARATVKTIQSVAQNIERFSGTSEPIDN